MMKYIRKLIVGSIFLLVLVCIIINGYIKECNGPARGARDLVSRIRGAEARFFEVFGRYATYDELSTQDASTFGVGGWAAAVVREYSIEIRLHDQTYEIAARPLSWKFCRSDYVLSERGVWNEQ